MERQRLLRRRLLCVVGNKVLSLLWPPPGTARSWPPPAWIGAGVFQNQVVVRGAAPSNQGKVKQVLRASPLQMERRYESQNICISQLLY